jgi:hypothetical protein
MAQAGYTPIQLYYSTTTTNVPSAGNLASGELAINITDGKLFYKDNGGVVRVIAGTGGTGVVAGSNTQVQFNNNGVFGASANLTFDGTTLVASNLTDSSLTSGRVTYATTGGNLTDSANLTFDGTNLTLGGGTANGVPYLNGSKVLTTGSALSFDGTVLGSAGSSSGTVLEVLRLSNNGIGDGTQAQVSFRAASTNYAQITGGFSGGPSLISNVTAGGYHALQIGSSEQMRLTSTGLGIGTSSPTTKLTVAGSTKIGLGAGSNSATLMVNNLSGSATGVQLFQDGVESWIMEVPASSTGLRWTASGAEHMRLTSAGNLGIGTSSPGVKLDVVGLARINTGTYAAGYGLTFQANSETSRTYQMGMVTGGNFAIYDSAAAATRVTLDTSGNLGLGVTPSAWSVRTIQVPNNYAFGHLGVSNNAFYDGAWKYITTAAATVTTGTGGSFTWNIAASGTAGDPISFTQAMTLTSGGNLLVKTTADNGVTCHFNGGANANIIRLTGASTTNSGYIGMDGDNFTISTGASILERARITSGGYFKASDTGVYASSTDSYHELRSSNPTGDWTAVISSSTATSGNAYGVFIKYEAAAPNAATNPFLSCSDNVTQRAAIRSNGGLANYQSNNVDLSDARTKKGITPAPSYWGKIGALEIVTYKYNDQTHDDVNIGVIAQQVESVEPVWVDADGFGEIPEDGVPLKTVYTKDITFAAIKALQEAMARIEQLEAKVAALEAA